MTMAGRVLDRRRGAGRPPGPRADLFSGLHSGTGALKPKTNPHGETAGAAVGY